MTLDTGAADQSAKAEECDGAVLQQPHAAWASRWLVSGAIAIAASFCWPPQSARPSLVMLGLDQPFWSWLVAVSGAIAVGVGLIGFISRVGRSTDLWWHRMLLSLCSFGVVVLLCVAAIPALLYAALFFDTRYRDLGNAHGDGGVVAFTPSNGYTDAKLVFGTRHGAFVDFDPDTRVIVPDRRLDLDDWHFALRSTPTVTQVRYSRTTGSPDTRITIVNRIISCADG